MPARLQGVPTVMLALLLALSTDILLSISKESWSEKVSFVSPLPGDQSSSALLPKGLAFRTENRFWHGVSERVDIITKTADRGIGECGAEMLVTS